LRRYASKQAFPGLLGERIRRYFPADVPGRATKQVELIQQEIVVWC
jgi:hypothetical protein